MVCRKVLVANKITNGLQVLHNIREVAFITLHPADPKGAW